MKTRFLLNAVCGLAFLVASGCASISVQSHAFVGSPIVSPTLPDHVEILQSQPKRPRDRLGQIFVSVEGQPKREEIENRLRKEAAKLGADAVFVASDRLHIMPYVYWDPWFGPAGTGQETRRDIVAVAIKWK